MCANKRQNAALKAANQLQKKPSELWGINMTKIKVESWRWLYLVVVKDWGSKKIVDWSLSVTTKTRD